MALRNFSCRAGSATRRHPSSPFAAISKGTLSSFSGPPPGGLRLAKICAQAFLLAGNKQTTDTFLCPGTFCVFVPSSTLRYQLRMLRCQNISLSRAHVHSSSGSEPYLLTYLIIDRHGTSGCTQYKPQYISIYIYLICSLAASVRSSQNPRAKTGKCTVSLPLSVLVIYINNYF